MSSTGKMVLFFLAATVANILLMVVFLAVIIIGLGLIMPKSPATPYVALVLSIGAIVLTFIIYGRIMKKLTPWLEKNVPQLFKKRK